MKTARVRFCKKRSAGNMELKKEGRGAGGITGERD